MSSFSLLAGITAALYTTSAHATEDIYPTEEEILQLKLLNDLRAQGHACFGKTYPPNPVPLTWNCALWRAARAHSRDMATNNFFSHTGSDGSEPGDRTRRFGETFSNENIASGYDDALRSFTQWMDSGLGHCTGMMEPRHKSMAAARVDHYAADYWHYWTQMTSVNEPNPDTQDCLNPQGLVPVPAPTPPPSFYPTLASKAATVDQMMDFEPSSYEMELLRLLNLRRVAGNTEECYGDFHTDLEPLEWNCPLFKVGRHHMHDNLVHDDFDRTGSDGKTFKERMADYNIPYTCISFKLSGNEDGYWTSPARMVDRLVRMACWAVFGPEYKSLATVFARKENVEPGSQFPAEAWYVLFGRFTPDPYARCNPDSPAASPVPMPTPAPSDQPSPASTPAPTDAPTGEPSAVPTTEAPAPVADPTEAPDQAVDCGALEKKECKKAAQCAYKRTCKQKSKFCPKQKTSEKCAKFECIWDLNAEICGW